VTPEERLAELGHELPPPNPAVGTYVGAVTVGSIVFVSGHGPYKDGQFVYKGKLGRDVDVATGQDAARLTILNLLASLKARSASSIVCGAS
jgi:enamine deaminase RidA (YjgF/YER057c/UK114 family)